MSVSRGYSSRGRRSKRLSAVGRARHLQPRRGLGVLAIGVHQPQALRGPTVLGISVWGRGAQQRIPNPGAGRFARVSLRLASRLGQSQGTNFGVDCDVRRQNCKNRSFYGGKCAYFGTRQLEHKAELSRHPESGWLRRCVYAPLTPWVPHLKSSPTIRA